MKSLLGQAKDLINNIYPLVFYGRDVHYCVTNFANTTRIESTNYEK